MWVVDSIWWGLLGKPEFALFKRGRGKPSYPKVSLNTPHFFHCRYHLECRDITQYRTMLGREPHWKDILSRYRADFVFTTPCKWKQTCNFSLDFQLSPGPPNCCIKVQRVWAREGENEVVKWEEGNVLNWTQVGHPLLMFFRSHRTGSDY